GSRPASGVSSSSDSVFQSPQDEHRPDHLGAPAPQLMHRKTVLVRAMGPTVGDGGDSRRGWVERVFPHRTTGQSRRAAPITATTAAPTSSTAPRATSTSVEVRSVEADARRSVSVEVPPASGADHLATP